MLRWRLSLGISIIAVLAGLFWLDEWLRQLTAIRGIALFPVLIALAVMADREVIELTVAGGLRPVRWVVYAGTLLVLTAVWIAPSAGRFTSASVQPALSGTSLWTLLALAVAVILVLLAEMLRYQGPGGAMTNAAAAIFAVVYVGFLLSFLVQLHVGWGAKALISALVVAKMGDTGAYAVGRLVGRTRMAPGLSPGKTIEGAVGGIAFASAGAWLVFRCPPAGSASAGLSSAPEWGWIAFGVLVGLAGMLGDLAESLIKRDVDRKHSSRWMPGFGGVLDVLDSLLLAGPAACFCWALGVVA